MHIDELSTDKSVNLLDETPTEVNLLVWSKYG